MYPINPEEQLENASISETLKNTIMKLEGLEEAEVYDNEKVNLYKVDFSKIDVEAKKEYVINVVNGNLYSLQYEEYKGQYYHTPRLGVAIVGNEMTKPGTYEIIVDAGQLVSWESMQIVYKEFVENSLTCKVYTSDDEKNWTEVTLELINNNEQTEKYNFLTTANSQFLKIQIEIKSVNGNNSKVDYVMVNFYKFKDTGREPEVTVSGAEIQNGVYSIPTPSNGETEATGTANVVQKIEVPEDGEFILDLGEVYGNPETTVKITKADGTEETIDMTGKDKISVPAGTTIEVTSELQAGDGVEEIKLLKKESELSQKKIENSTKTENEQAQWITVEQNKYVYNNGGTGFWEKCLVNDVEVDETGIIMESEDAVKRIRIRYQTSDGNGWSSTFTNIQDAENIQYLKVIVDYQVIKGNEYGDTSNNTIKVILNDGSWKATFVDENETTLYSKRLYFTNSNKTVELVLPSIEITDENRVIGAWSANGAVYHIGETITLTKDTVFEAIYNLKSSNLIGGISKISESGYHKIEVAGKTSDGTEETVTYSTHVILKNGDLVLDGINNVEGATLASNVYEFGDNTTDVATDTDNAENMVILKVNGNLTINEGVTLTACKSDNGYGGPKGMMIYCTGTITNNGIISMTARGAKAEGQNVYLWKNADGSYEYIPKDGGLGGEGQTVSTQTSKDGINGYDGSGRATGGGGSGAIARWGSGTAVTGSGGQGTSYSGGTGSGACCANISKFTSESGSANGGKRTEMQHLVLTLIHLDIMQVVELEIQEVTIKHMVK